MSRTILITGAGTGIGAEAARHLAAGNTLLVHYNRSRKDAERVADDVRDLGGEAHVLQSDLSTEQGCRGLIDRVEKQFDHLDALVNNAGALLQRHQAEELEWSLMERIFALNVFSVMWLSSSAIPLLRRGSDPNIVNVTSIAMRHGAPTATIYGAAKSAVDSFTRGMAREVAPEIRVNAVAPGVIVTPFHERYSTPERMANFADATPLKRNGRPIHVAMAIRHLIENDFITGETIDVNGGLFMR